MKRYKRNLIKKLICMVTLTIFSLSMITEPVLAYENLNSGGAESSGTALQNEEGKTADDGAASGEKEAVTETDASKDDPASGGQKTQNVPKINTDAFNKQSADKENKDPAAEPSADSWRFSDGYIREDAAGPRTYGAMRISGSTAWSKDKNGHFLNSSGGVINGAIRKGIDVSKWQGTIDWKKVKAAGIDFAIIRCGYGNNVTSYDDAYFKKNVEGCQKYGIPYGVYLYSYAESSADAGSEAAHALRLLNSVSYKPSYPVYYDLEDKVVKKKGKTAIQGYANTFCSTLENAGYRAGVYANLDWWDNILDTSSLDKYEKWVAQWNDRCAYEGNYRIWQCASDGTVSGINGKVDIDFEFQRDDTAYYMGGWVKNESGQYVFKRPDGSMPKSQWLNYHGSKYYVNSAGVRLSGLQSIGSSKYYFDSSGALQVSKWLTLSGKKYYAQSSGALATGYKKIGSYYYGFNSSGAMLTGTATLSGKQYKFMSDGRAYLYTAKLKENLNYRTGPGTGYKKKGTYKKNKTVTVIREQSGWGQLTNGYWVKLSYTKKATKYPVTVKTSTSSSSSKSSSASSSSYKAKTTTAVNYRTGPGTSYKRKGTYKKGTTITIKSTKSGWGKMSNGYWIKLSYTKKVSSSSSSSKAKSSSKSSSYKVKTKTALNYRTGPGTSYKRKGTYKKGKTLTIKSTKNGWGKMSNGYWIKLSYTKRV